MFNKMLSCRLELNVYRISLRTFCTDQKQSFSVISFYKFKKILEPKELVETLRPCLKEINVKGRIYINTVGINSQICLPSGKTDDMKKLFADYYSKNIEYKVHYSNFQVFNRLRDLKIVN